MEFNILQIAGITVAVAIVLIGVGFVASLVDLRLPWIDPEGGGDRQTGADRSLAPSARPPSQPPRGTDAAPAASGAPLTVRIKTLGILALLGAGVFLAIRYLDGRTVVLLSVLASLLSGVIAGYRGGDGANVFRLRGRLGQGDGDGDGDGGDGG